MRTLPCLQLFTAIPPPPPLQPAGTRSDPSHLPGHEPQRKSHLPRREQTLPESPVPFWFFPRIGWVLFLAPAAVQYF